MRSSPAAFQVAQRLIALSTFKSRPAPIQHEWRKCGNGTTSTNETQSGSAGNVTELTVTHSGASDGAVGPSQHDLLPRQVGARRTGHLPDRPNRRVRASFSCNDERTTGQWEMLGPALQSRPRQQANIWEGKRGRDSHRFAAIHGNEGSAAEAAGNCAIVQTRDTTSASQKATVASDTRKGPRRSPPRRTQSEQTPSGKKHGYSLTRRVQSPGELRAAQFRGRLRRRVRFQLLHTTQRNANTVETPRDSTK